ncbi:hypothetical protein ABMA27_011014 [Loxostege sticticalis]|uniref:Reverse transcriptase domain-containing protein n=1 Tax=Loxostege sticticalis TaxID=481309 RepID=A0ABR3H309_LOXSC
MEERRNLVLQSSADASQYRRLMLLQKRHYVGSPPGSVLETFPVGAGVRQGDVINGEYITHLRFADDIVVMAETLEDLGTMLDGLSRASQQVGLKMNMDKTKIMSNVHVAPTPLKVGDSALEVVDEYVYLGQTVQLGKSNFEKEVNRRNSAGQRSGSYVKSSRPKYRSV